MAFLIYRPPFADTIQWWSLLWPPNAGPDFATETEAWKSNLRTLQQLTKTAFKIHNKEILGPLPTLAGFSPQAPRARPLPRSTDLATALTNQYYFNGCGKHLACDIAFYALEYPCVPFRDVALDDARFNRLIEGEHACFP